MSIQESLHGQGVTLTVEAGGISWSGVVDQNVLSEAHTAWEAFVQEHLVVMNGAKAIDRYNLEAFFAARYIKTKYADERYLGAFGGHVGDDETISDRMPELWKSVIDATRDSKPVPKMSKGKSRIRPGHNW